MKSSAEDEKDAAETEPKSRSYQWPPILNKNCKSAREVAQQLRIYIAGLEKWLHA